MGRLPSYKWYLASALLVALARWGATAFMALVLLAPLGIFPLPTITELVIFLFSFVGCGLIAVAIALSIRCPNCGKPMMWSFDTENPEARRIASLSLKRRIADFFFPSEITGREVRCARCGSRFALRGEA